MLHELLKLSFRAAGSARDRWELPVLVRRRILVHYFILDVRCRRSFALKWEPSFVSWKIRLQPHATDTQPSSRVPVAYMGLQSMAEADIEPDPQRREHGGAFCSDFAEVIFATLSRIHKAFCANDINQNRKLHTGNLATICAQYCNIGANLNHQTLNLPSEERDSCKHLFMSVKLGRTWAQRRQIFIGCHFAWNDQFHYFK